MHSLIKRQHDLGVLFSNTKGLCEVYADLDYTFASPCVKFILLGKDVNTVMFLDKLLLLCTDDTKIYYTEDSLDLALQGKKIIWREGKWYL